MNTRPVLQPLSLSAPCYTPDVSIQRSIHSVLRRRPTTNYERTTTGRHEYSKLLGLALVTISVVVLLKHEMHASQASMFVRECNFV